MSLLRNANALYYHPLDSDTESVQSYDWSRSANGVFNSGIIISGFTQSSDITVDIKGLVGDGGYDDLTGYDHFAIAFWSSGFYGSPLKDDKIWIGFGGTAVTDSNGLEYFMSEATAAPFIKMQKRGLSGESRQVSTFPSTTGWHFTVVDFSRQGSVWRYSISINGSGWQIPGSGHNIDLPDTDSNCIIALQLESTSETVILDEVAVWAGHDQFTEPELSNLYELANSLDLSLDQYTDTFGTPASSGIDCFIHGSEQVTGSATLFISAQTANQSATLFTQGHEQITDNRSLYIEGAAIPASGSATLFIEGVLTHSDSTTLYIKGPVLSSDNVDCFIHGFAVASGTSSLYIKGEFPTVDAFVSVVANAPTASADLFIYGTPSGESPTSFISHSATLFIKDDGSNNTTNASISSFVKVEDAIAVAFSGIWPAFARVGNTVNASASLYINAHASGSAPRGVQVSASGTLFVAGLGDALDDGYSVSTLDTSAFAKVHLGINGSLDLYISGSLGTVQISAESNLYIFGIQGIQSGSRSLYIEGNNVASNSASLFVLGIQGIATGSATLYIKVTDIGLFNQNTTLYTHGF